jgi:hypothetical protein
LRSRPARERVDPATAMKCAACAASRSSPHKPPRRGCALPLGAHGGPQQFRGLKRFPEKPDVGRRRQAILARNKDDVESGELSLGELGQFDPGAASCQGRIGHQERKLWTRSGDDELCGFSALALDHVEVLVPQQIAQEFALKGSSSTISASDGIEPFIVVSAISIVNSTERQRFIGRRRLRSRREQTAASADSSSHENARC